MRRIMGWAAALVLAPAIGANAQDALNAFGSYPAGITTGSSYGFYPGGYRQGYSSYPAPGGSYVVPQTRYYSSGFYGGVPGTVTYGPGVNYSAPSAGYYYGSSVPTYRSYATVPGTWYSNPGYSYTGVPGVYRGGLLGRRTYYRW